MLKKFTFILALLASLSNVYAHGGRTDSEGCHNDKKHGTKHCH